MGCVHTHLAHSRHFSKTYQLSTFVIVLSKSFSCFSLLSFSSIAFRKHIQNLADPISTRNSHTLANSLKLLNSLRFENSRTPELSNSRRLFSLDRLALTRSLRSLVSKTRIAKTFSLLYDSSLFALALRFCSHSFSLLFIRHRFSRKLSHWQFFMAFL